MYGLCPEPLKCLLTCRTHSALPTTLMLVAAGMYGHQQLYSCLLQVMTTWSHY